MPTPLSLSQQPSYMGMVGNNTIHTLSEECIGPDLIAVDLSTASGAWTTDLVIYYPLLLMTDMLVSQFFWFNGSAVSGNSDCGIYSEDGQTKIGSTGSTANSGTSVVQITNVSDFWIPGNTRLWLALGCDNNTQTYVRGDMVISGLDYLGVKQQASGWSGGLPATATFAAPSVATTPICGFTAQSVI